MDILGALGFVVISIIAYNREERINQIFSNHKFINKISPFFVCFILSFLLVAQLDLSPFRDYTSQIDSSVYLYIGKSMHNGMIPYKDLFDHKGIILYFIQYIGYVIGFGHQIGVWILEFVNLFITAIIFYFTSKLFTSSRIVCYLSIFIVINLVTLGYFQINGGNLAEEYALPCIAFSLYIYIKFFVTNSFKKWQIIILGCSFTIVIFLKLNLVIIWGTLLLAVSIYLLKHKRILDIFQCMLLFILGCIIILIPIFMYLKTTGALKDMIDYYFIFNSSYAGAHSRKGIIFFFFDSIPYMGISSFFIVYSIVLNYRKKCLWLNLVAFFTAFLSIAIVGRFSFFYGIILIPFFIVPTVVSIFPLLEKTKEICKKICNKKILIIVLLVSMMCIVIKPTYNYYQHLKTSKEPDQLCEYLYKNTNSKDDVLILNNSVIYYLKANRHTKNKFFYQQPPIEINKNLYNAFIKEIKSKPSDYIVNKKDVSLKSMGNNYNKSYNSVISFLNNECKKGNYQLEDHDGFQVYVRK